MLQPLLLLPPPPPFLLPAGRRGEGKRAREFETTRKQTTAPTSPPTTSLADPSSPQCHAAHGCVTVGSASRRRSRPCPQPEKRERERGLVEGVFPFSLLFFRTK